MSDWNKLILRQIKKQFGSVDHLPENLRSFLQVVSDTYDHYDKDRRMLERSIELSSEEMKALNVRLRAETDQHNQVLFGKLQESLELLNDTAPAMTGGSDYLKLTHIADALKSETVKRKAAEEEKKIQERLLINANRMYRLISQINQMIVRVRSEAELYRDACQIAVRFGQFKLASIALIDQNGAFTAVANEGAVDDLTALSLCSEKIGQKVLLKNSTLIINDLRTEPALNETWDSLELLGYGSCTVLPIRTGGCIIGVFALYASENNFFSSEEVSLLEEAAGDISFALDVLENDRQRAMTQQRLQKSEWRLKQAQAIAHLGSWFLDLKTGIATWSKEALRIYGMDTKETQQSYDSWLARIHPDDLDEVLEQTSNGRANLARTAFYHRIVRTDGVIRYVYSQSDFDFDEFNQPVGLYGVVHDITEIREQERALMESQSGLQAIFNSTSEGFILTDLDCRIKAFNSKALEMMHANSGRVFAIGDDLLRFAGRSRKGKYDHLAREVAAGNTLYYQLAFNRKNEGIKWFDFTINPVYSNQVITGIVVTSSDVTERKLSELRLQESEKRYSDLFKLSPLPMWVYDQKDLRFLDVNQAAIDQYGYSRKEFLAMTIRDIRPPEDLPLLEETIEKNRRKRAVVTDQHFRHRKKDGTLINVEIQSNALVYKNAKAKLIVAKDVTESTRYIETIERHNARLKEIAWMQSHVVRAPLARILALVPMITANGESGDEQKRVVEYLRISANELDEVIRNINQKTYDV